MNFDLSNLPLPMPVAPDLGHAALGVLAVILLLLLVFKCGRSKAVVATADQVDSAAAPQVSEKPAQLVKAAPDAALQVLTLLQQNGRFVDFIQEDLGGYSDADIGAVARVVHEGSKKVVSEYFTLVPVRDEDEESHITLPEGFDSASVRLTGNVAGEPPFSGTLVHRGWRVAEVKLPRLAEGHDASIIAAAEVEL
jgi:hypothetical protein